MYHYHIFCLILFSGSISGSHINNLAWNGGPIHLECEHSVESLTKSGQYVRENVIAIKAVKFGEEIYILTPRFKKGVLATVWMLVQGRRGVELQAFPGQSAHIVADCQAIQNAIDFHLDHLGNLWILDSGTVDTMERPHCTCQPKVVVINILFKKLTKHIGLTSAVEPTSVLQNIVVEHSFGAKPFVYISDASRGAVIVHDTSSDAQWSVVVCAPAAGFQMALVRRSPGHAVLAFVRPYNKGILEMDTAPLKRRNSRSPLRVFDDHESPMVLLGSGNHRVYLRHLECSDVLSWDTREPFNSSRLTNLHSPGPRLTPTSVATEPLKHHLLVLDSNYADTVHSNQATYHRITFIAN